MSTGLATRSSFSRLAGSNYGDAFPDPFIDVASLNMPQSMRNALQWCLPPGALIECEGGRLTPVEKIEKGMKVLTRGGTIEEVVQTGVRQVNEPIVRLEFAGRGKTLPLRLTANHNVWRIRTPRLKPGRVAASLDKAKAVKVRADAVQAGDYFATPLPRRDVPIAPTHPPRWPWARPAFPVGSLACTPPKVAAFAAMAITPAPSVCASRWDATTRRQAYCPTC